MMSPHRPERMITWSMLIVRPWGSRQVIRLRPTFNKSNPGQTGELRPNLPKLTIPRPKIIINNKLPAESGCGIRKITLNYNFHKLTSWDKEAFMSRKAPINVPGAPHHIIDREIARRRIFSDDQVRQIFIDWLGDIVTETKTFCFAWALSANPYFI